MRGKTVNPQWNIPESIRKEHIRERGDDRTFIPGGAEDNPLGNRRIELTLPSYGIHGTDIPWGVGMLVSHGCIRLYPEDIERLFPRVAVGTAGEFTYQPIKIGHKATSSTSRRTTTSTASTQRSSRRPAACWHGAGSPRSRRTSW